MSRGDPLAIGLALGTAHGFPAGVRVAGRKREAQSQSSIEAWKMKLGGPYSPATAAELRTILQHSGNVWVRLDQGKFGLKGLNAGANIFCSRCSSAAFLDTRDARK